MRRRRSRRRVPSLFDEVESRGLTVDVLINNAGIGTIGPVAESTVDAEIAQVRVNVEAVIDLTTRAVQQMVPRGRGAILNVGSTAGYPALSRAVRLRRDQSLRSYLHRRAAR